MKGQEMKRLWEAITTVIRAIYHRGTALGWTQRSVYPTPVHRSAARNVNTVPVEL